jgi:hypothetical protein
LFSQLVAVVANVGVHAEKLLKNDNGGSRRSFRRRDIGAERPRDLLS